MNTEIKTKRKAKHAVITNYGRDEFVDVGYESFEDAVS